MTYKQAYRIKPSKPEPKVETVQVDWGAWRYGVPEAQNGPTHRITFSLIDGKPDCDSVKMEEL